MALALKLVPAETFSSVSYSEQLFRSTQDAIIDERSTDENDDKSAAPYEWDRELFFSVLLPCLTWPGMRVSFGNGAVSCSEKIKSNCCFIVPIDAYVIFIIASMLGAVVRGLHRMI